MRNVGEHTRVENDGEHTFSMMMLALEFMSKEKTELDQQKVLKMIAYHELCEIDAGDTTPFDNVPKEEKHRELVCIERLASEYNMPEIKELWLEFEENTTPEAKFVKEIDKYDAVMQSKVYSKTLGDDIYNEFHNSCKFSDKYVKFDL